MTTDHADVLIIGAGPVGCALATAFHGGGMSAVVLESKPRAEQGDDPRTIALSYGSRLILERLGAWTLLSETTPISRIHISQRGYFGRTVLTAREAGVPTLGFVTHYSDLNRALGETLKRTGVPVVYNAGIGPIHTSNKHVTVEVSTPAGMSRLTAPMVVFAEGGTGQSPPDGFSVHEHDYGQWAVVAKVLPSLPHQGVAYERFTPDGPMALLPIEDRFALIWTLLPDAAENLLALDDASFLEKLHEQFGDRVGSFREAGTRAGFPLRLRYVTPVAARRVVFAGNAAQTLHPVAGQGFNLGLRDAWELADEACNTPLEEIGGDGMLARYRSRRSADALGGMGFTHTLVKLFSNSDPFLSAVRGMALATLDVVGPAKTFIARRMIFGSRGL